MAHEPGPFRILTIDQLPSRPGVSPLRRALPGRHPAARIFLLGSVSGHGLRATYLSVKFARHRGLSAFDTGLTSGTPVRSARSSLLGFLRQRRRIDWPQGIARSGPGKESGAAQLCKVVAPGAGSFEFNTSSAFARE